MNTNDPKQREVARNLLNSIQNGQISGGRGAELNITLVCIILLNEIGGLIGENINLRTRVQNLEEIVVKHNL